MSASEAQVAAAMEASLLHEEWVRYTKGQHHTLCRCKAGGWMTWPEHREHRARAVADAVVAAGPDPAKVAAEALREAAADLDWMRPDKSPCDNPEACCGSEASCDAMQPSVHVVGGAWLRARADRIEAGQ